MLLMLLMLLMHPWLDGPQTRKGCSCWQVRTKQRYLYAIASLAFLSRSLPNTHFTLTQPTGSVKRLPFSAREGEDCPRNMCVQKHMLVLVPPSTQLAIIFCVRCGPQIFHAEENYFANAKGADHSCGPLKIAAQIEGRRHL